MSTDVHPVSEASGAPCPNCSAPTASDALFCFQCGISLARCHACHQPLPEAARFCTHCGAEQTEQKTSDSQEAAAEARIAVDKAVRKAKASVGGGGIVANVMLFAGLLAVILVVIKEMNEGKPQEISPFAAPPPSSVVQQPKESSSGGSLRGVVELQGEAPQGAVLFVIARIQGVRRGPPVAVKRIANPKFPLEFELNADDVMQPGMPFEGPFDVSARLDEDGDAMSKSSNDLTTSAQLGRLDGLPVTLTLGSKP